MAPPEVTTRKAEKAAATGAVTTATSEEQELAQLQIMEMKKRRYQQIADLALALRAKVQAIMDAKAQAATEAKDLDAAENDPTDTMISKKGTCQVTSKTAGKTSSATNNVHPFMTPYLNRNLEKHKQEGRGACSPVEKDSSLTEDAVEVSSQCSSDWVEVASVASSFEFVDIPSDKDMD